MAVDIQSLAVEVLDEGFVLELATIDSGGPWSAPVTYVREGFNLWWVSEPKTRHSRALQDDPRAAGSIVVGYLPGEERALKMEGIVSIHSELRPDLEEMLAKKRHATLEEERNEIRNGAYLWYCLKPSKMILIYEKYFGYDTKEVRL